MSFLMLLSKESGTTSSLNVLLFTLYPLDYIVCGISLLLRNTEMPKLLDAKNSYFLVKFRFKTFRST